MVEKRRGQSTSFGWYTITTSFVIIPDYEGKKEEEREKNVWVRRERIDIGISGISGIALNWIGLSTNVTKPGTCH